MDKCNIDCLNYDAFQFPGADQVVSVSVQYNSFAALPEELLWGMESMLYFYARYSTSLISLPEKFFLNQSQLKLIFFTESARLGSEGLPDGLFKGLSSLMYLSFNLCAYRNLPNMDDLTALIVFYGAGYVWH